MKDLLTQKYHTTFNSVIILAFNFLGFVKTESYANVLLRMLSMLYHETAE